MIRFEDAVENYDARTELEKKFEKSNIEYMFEALMDEELVCWRIESKDTMAFNIWSFLTQAEPNFDEIRIRVATEQDLEYLSNFDEHDEGEEK